MILFVSISIYCIKLLRHDVICVDNGISALAINQLAIFNLKHLRQFISENKLKLIPWKQDYFRYTKNDNFHITRCLNGHQRAGIIMIRLLQVIILY